MQSGQNLSKPEILLEILQDGQWHTAHELSEKIGWRFSAALHILRERGVEIRTHRIEKNDFVYKLIKIANSNKSEVA